MATPPAKRFRPQSLLSSFAQEVGKVVKEAQSIPFPWNEAVPEKIRGWFEAFGKSHNTAPEYCFVGALVTAAVIMGPKSFVKVRETFQEPTNLFAICIGFPGSGKSQAHGMTVREPLQSLPSPLSTILVDDYTKRGLFRHLQSHNGRALLAHEEMGAFFDLVQKRQLEGNAERQLYCRLYDGGQWVTSTGLKSEGRQETEHNCVCIQGYLQPQPFIERIYPQLTESDDGFVDRLLLCFPKTHVLLEEELDVWCSRLHTYAVTSLVEPFKLIAEWHMDGDHVYTFSEEGKQVYRCFANEMAEIMWETGAMTQGNVSKDKCSMIRLSGIIHVLYRAMDRCLTTHTTDSTDTHMRNTPAVMGASDRSSGSPYGGQSLSPDSPPPLPPPLERHCPPPMSDEQPPDGNIPEEEARMAVALTEYFQQQRWVYEQVRVRKGESCQQIGDSALPTVASYILLTKGAFCTPRSVIRSVTTRSKPTTAEVVEQMKKLDEEGMGKFHSVSEKEKVFYKRLPIEANRELLCNRVNFETYDKNFKKGIDTKFMTTAQIHRLLAKSPDKDILLNEYGYEFH